MIDTITLQEKSRRIRRDILDLGHKAGSVGAHMGGCLSMVEILTVLYMEVLRYRPQDPLWEGRDRIVFSKAHASIALYAAMHVAGCISDAEMELPLYGETTFLNRHAHRNMAHGLEMSGGSLGQGLSYCVGIACALRLRGNEEAKVYAVVGDGECNEGSIWEAAALAGHKGLSNLVVIIDKNGLQLDGWTRDIINMDNMEERWHSFGFDTCSIDGHSYSQIEAALRKHHPTKPLAIIANTIKGKGVSFIENQIDWHDNYVTDELYQRAIKEIEG